MDCPLCLPRIVRIDDLKKELAEAEELLDKVYKLLDDGSTAKADEAFLQIEAYLIKE